MRVSGLFPAVQTAAPRPTNAEKEGKKYAEKSMHLLRKQKKKEKKYVLQIQKKYAERAWPCGRAASGRTAWREE